jgi:hypothetical protein
MLTGERPTGPIEPPSRKVQIDVRLDEVVLRALENEPNLRWQSAADLRTQLQLVTGSAAVPSRAAASPSPARHLWRGVLVGLMVLVTAASLALAVTFLGPEPRVRVMLAAGGIVSLLAATVSGWIYAARSKRSAARHGTNPPLFLSTAPHLGLVLVIASLVVPLGFVSTLSMAARMRLVAERRSQVERKIAAERAFAAAQRQVKDAEAQSLDAQRTLKQLRESPTPEANSVAEAEERVKQVAAMSAAAEADRQEAIRQNQQARVVSHSEVSPGAVFYLLPALLFALPGTILGWRHLLAIRGLSRPRPHQLSGMIAALTWPLLIGALVVGAIVLLPLNHGQWATLGLVLAMLAVLGTLGLSIGRILRWLEGQAFLPSAASATAGAMPAWTRKSLGVLFLALAVLVPLAWLATIRSDNSRELGRWHLEMTRLQRDWTRATTDRFTAQTALDRHAIAAASLTTPQERTKAEAERQKLTRALGRAEALVATLDTKMRVLNETGTKRNSRSFEQLAAILVGAVLGFCGLLLLLRATTGQSAPAQRAPLTWLALGAILIVGFGILFLTFSREVISDPATDANAPAQPQAGQDAASSALPTVNVATEGDLLAQVERRVLQAQYEKLLNDLMNAQNERDLLATRTGVPKEVLEREANDLQQKIRVLSEHRDILQRKIETLKP